MTADLTRNPVTTDGAREPAGFWVSPQAKVHHATCQWWRRFVTRRWRGPFRTPEEAEQHAGVQTTRCEHCERYGRL